MIKTMIKLFLVVYLYVSTTKCQDHNEVCISLREESSGQPTLVSRTQTSIDGCTCDLNRINARLGAQEKAIQNANKQINDLKNRVDIVDVIARNNPNQVQFQHKNLTTYSIVNETTTTTYTLQNTVISGSCFNGLIFGNTCIKLYNTIGYGAQYEKALRLCNFQMAEITSEAMYHAVVDYVRKTWRGGGSQVTVWLGMTYKPNREWNLELSDGRMISLTPFWHPGSPGNHVRNLSLKVILHGDSSSKGLKTSYDWSELIPLCSFNL
ncbi:unnamed protein product [Clavelina lepadiformis]|uniref:C-type lectin domain-containing protein n=1 Tax=Clavelina lepadiformis TaxID=159417 RepID=A0ABP0FKI1_CLALP